MEITIRNVTASNLMEVIMDPDTYVIRKSWLIGKFELTPIGKADVRDLLSDKVRIVKITEK